MRLGQRVLKLLKEYGYQQNEFALAIGSKPTTVSGWSNENRNPTSELIIPICEFLGISPNELFEFEAAVKLDGKELSDREINLIRHFRELDLDGKAHVESKAAEEHDRIKIAGDSSITKEQA